MKSPAGALVLCTLFAACETKEPESPIVLGNFQIHFEPDVSVDALALAGSFRKTIQLLEQHFNDDTLRPHVTGFPCDVWLHSRAAPMANDDLATVKTETVKGVYHAEIHLLATSAYVKKTRTHIGEKKDHIYNERLLVHEYAAPLLDTITSSKTKGWRFFSAPSWFIQGYEEYLALTCSNEHSRTVTKTRYLQILRDQPGRVRLEAGVTVESPYIDGAMLVTFMHEQFGSEKVHALLLGSESTFEEAISVHLTRFPDRFFEAWQAWLASRG